MFVYLTRHDKIKQAVSYVKAPQTGLWHVAADGTDLERLSPPQEPVCDGDEIRACVETMTTYDRDWEDWFKRQGIDPVRNAATGIRPGVKKLADGINQDWVARFVAEVDTA